MRPIETVLGGDIVGLDPDVSWDDYRILSFLNPSVIVNGCKSMRHLWHAWHHPREDTPDLLWGRAVHCLCFEPRHFAQRYACWGGRRQGKEYQQFCQDHQGKDVLTKAQWLGAQDAALSFVNDAQVIPRIAKGRTEVSVFAVEYGMQCKGRIDWISTDLKILDLKTTKNILAAPFGRDFYKYHYDIKLGLYQRWVEIATEHRYPVEVACLEKEPPYDVALIPVPDAVLTYGAEKGLKILREVRKCLETGVWPGVAGGAEYFLETPVWEMEDVELEGAEEA